MYCTVFNRYTVIINSKYGLYKCKSSIGLGLWCLMALSTIFQLNRGSQFYCCSKPEYADIFLPDIHILI